MIEKIATIFCILEILIGLNTNSSISGQIPFKLEVKDSFKSFKSLKLSSIGKELTYIPLETKPDCVIEKISKIEMSDLYIFVYESDRILQFERNGKFIRQIGSNGRGPQEYFRINDFCIDEKRKEIYIISSPNLMSVFDFNGAFKNVYKLPYQASQIIIKDDKSFMFHLVNSPRLQNPSWIITDRTGKSQISYENTLNKKESSFLVVVLKSPLYSFGNSLHFNEFRNDTVYYFKANAKAPYAIFILGDLKIKANPSASEFKKEKGFRDKIIPTSIYENKDFVFINFSKGYSDGYYCSIFNKKTFILTFLEGNSFKNDLNGGMPFWPKNIIKDNLLIDYTDAITFLKYPLPKSLTGKITETSNPILMILK